MSRARLGSFGRNDAAALLLAAVFFGLGLSSMLQKSLTWDEPSYIASGYQYLTLGDFRFNSSHPPLLQDLVALPLLFMDIDPPPQEFSHWVKQGNPAPLLGRELLYRRGNDPLQIAFWARLPILLLGTALVVFVYLFGRELYGSGPALVGTALVAFSPNLLAHARLATEDLGCSALMFASLWTFHRATRGPRLGRWALCGVVTGLALLSKFTALLLLPIYGILTGALWLLGNPVARSARVLTGLGMVGLVSALVVGAGYNFAFDWSLYVNGVTSIYTDLVDSYSYYFAGRFHDGGLWYYAIGAFAMKTPLSTLILLAMAILVAVRDRERLETSLFLLVPPLVVVIASFFDSQSFGLRRILPVFPFLLLFTSGILSRAASPIRTAIVIALVAFSATEAIRIHPDYLSYFQPAVGGPRNGPRLLDDSNIDWGQDLPALARWQREHPEAAPLKIFYFGTAEPAAYGVDAVPMGDAEIARPEAGYYAVSAHALVWFRKQSALRRQNLDWLDLYQPIGRAGWSIYIYRFE